MWAMGQTRGDQSHNRLWGVMFTGRAGSRRATDHARGRFCIKILLIEWMLLVCVGVSYAYGHLPAWGSDKPTWGNPGGRSRRRF